MKYPDEPFIEYTDRDYPEYRKEENGNYMCKCFSCGEYFIGRKHSNVCKLCSQKTNIKEET